MNTSQTQTHNGPHRTTPHKMFWVVFLLALSLAGSTSCVRTYRIYWPSVNLLDLLEREKLERPGDPNNNNIGQRNFGRWLQAELTGIPPRELILRIDEYVGQGIYARHFYAYRISRYGPPKRMSPPLTHLGAQKGIYSYAKDIDRDGRQEFIVISLATDTEPDQISVHSWRGDRFHDQMWGESPGVDHVWFDHDDDGKRDMIAFRREGEEIKVDVLVRKQGYWRPIKPRRPVGQWLPRALNYILKNERIHRPWRLLPLFVGALKQRKLVPFHLPTAQRILKTYALSEDKAKRRAVFIEAMNWPNNEEGLHYARKILDTHQPDLGWLKAAEFLIEQGTHEDRTIVLGHIKKILHDISFELDVTALTDLFDAYQNAQDKRAFELIRQVVFNRNITLTRRQNLLSILGPRYSELHAPLSLILHGNAHPKLVPQAATALQASMNTTDDELHKQWRALWKMQELGVLLHKPNQKIRLAAAEALFAHPYNKGLIPLVLGRYLHENNSNVRAALLKTLHRHENTEQQAQIHSKALFARLPQALDYERRTIHKVLSTRTTRDVTQGLQQARSVQDLTPYLTAIRKLAPNPQEALWQTVPQALSKLLSHPKDHALRLSAAQTLRLINTPSARRILHNRLQHEPDISIRAKLMLYLALMNEPGIQPIILRTITHEQDDELLSSALRAARHFKTKPMQQALAQHVQKLIEQQKRPSMIALFSLRQIGGGDPVTFLKTHLRKTLSQPRPNCAQIPETVGAMFAFSPSQGHIWLKKVSENNPCSFTTQPLESALKTLTDHPNETQLSWLRQQMNHTQRPVRIAASRAVEALEKKRRTSQGSDLDKKRSTF